MLTEPDVVITEAIAGYHDRSFLDLEPSQPAILRGEHVAEIGCVGVFSDEAMRAVPIINEALSDPSGTLRLRAMYAAQYMGAHAKGTVPYLISAVNRLDVNSARAALALFSIGPDAAIAAVALVRALGAPFHNKGGAEVATAAEYALPRICSSPCPALLAGLTNLDWRVRLGSARVLGRMGRRATPAVAALNMATRDPRKEVRKAVEHALKRIHTGKAPITQYPERTELQPNQQHHGEAG